MDYFNGKGAPYALNNCVNHTLLLTVGPVNQCVCGVLVGGRGVSHVYLSTYANVVLY